jgi:hypothetical protein
MYYFLSLLHITLQFHFLYTDCLINTANACDWIIAPVDSRISNQFVLYSIATLLRLPFNSFAEAGAVLII